MSSNVRFQKTAEPGTAHTPFRTAPEQAHLGSESVPELCAALDHPEVEKRIRAARALGEIGDERAIGPLTDALADLSEARYAGVRRRRVVARALLGFLLAGGVAGLTFCSPYYSRIPLGELLLWISESHPVLAGGLLVIAMIAFALLMRRGSADARRMATIAAFADALGEIAARHPSPDLRGALADLTASRAAAGRASAEWLPTIDQAIARIEEATSEVQQLPLPSEQPDAPLPQLPLAIDGPRSAPISLPRPSEPVDYPFHRNDNR